MKIRTTFTVQVTVDVDAPADIPRENMILQINHDAVSVLGQNPTGSMTDLPVQVIEIDDAEEKTDHRPSTLPLTIFAFRVNLSNNLKKHKGPKEAPVWPKDLPKYRREFTKEQQDAVARWFAYHQSLRQLRVHQHMNKESFVRLEQNRPMSLFERQECENLAVEQDYLMMAIDYRIFEWELEKPTNQEPWL